MIRTLSLVLDEKGEKSLSLMEGEARDIDEFTLKFHDSEEIRSKFQKQIDVYLEQNKKYLESFKRNSRGRIVILELHNINNEPVYVPKRVLYKKYLVALDTMIKDEDTMKRFLKLEGRYVNEKKIASNITKFIKYKIEKGTNFRVRSQVDYLKREIKRIKDSFYDNLRSIAKAYEEECKTRKNLKTIDQIFKEYLEEQKLKKEAKEQTDLSKKTLANESYNKVTNKPNNQDDNDFDTIRVGDTFYNPEHLDLDDLVKIDTDEIIGNLPDGLGPKK